MGAAVIVHSPEDAERFVSGLSSALGHAGVESDTESWRLSVRDSLIDRIFSEGLKDASLMLVVLSQNNSNTDWSSLELELSVVERIQAVTRLCVLLLDGRQPPAELPEDVPVFALDHPGDVLELSGLIQELGPIMRGHYVPGNRPAGAEREGGSDGVLAGISNIGETEATVLALSCRCAVESNAFLVKADNVFELAAPLEIRNEDFHRCLDALENAGHIRGKRSNGGLISTFEVNRPAFGHYMDEVLDNTDEVVADLASEILAGVRDNETLVETFELPRLIVTYILDDLDEKGQITVIRQMRGNRRIKRVSPEFQQLYGE